MNASGEITLVAGSNDEVTPHLPEAPEPLSYPNTWPLPFEPCCTTIPPSPAAFEPEANLINLSATSKSVVCWKLAVPATVKFLDTTKSLDTVKS